MPMNYEAPLEAIRLAIAAALGAPDRVVMAKPQRAVEWEHRKTAARWTKGAWADLSLNGMVAIGRDMTRAELVSVPDPDPDAPPGTMRDMLVDVIAGNRTFHVTCIVRSDSQEPGLTAQVAAERLRTRLRLPRIKALYKAAGVGLSHVAFSGTHDWIGADERWLSEAVVDIVWLLAVNEVDVPDFATDYVAEVEAVGELDSARDGTPVVVSVDTDPATTPFVGP